MLTQEEIKQQLLGVRPNFARVFALRCSLRVLPFLESWASGHFSSWGGIETNKNLLAILTAQQTAICILRDHRKIPDHVVASVSASIASAVAVGTSYAAYTADAAATEAARAEAAYIAYSAAYSVSVYAEESLVTTADSADVAAATASAADSAAYGASSVAAAYAASAVGAGIAATADAAFAASIGAADARVRSLIERAIRSDLHLISGEGSNTLDSHVDLLESPLWKEPAVEWLALKQRFFEAFIRLDVGFGVWLDWYQDRVDGKRLDLEVEAEWANIPEEVQSQGVRATNAYLVLFTSNSLKKPLNLVRAIFIGNGAAGKTSLIRALHNEEVVEGKERMTPGIAIREWAVPETDIKARLWDFGGQVMSHSTHQFFLRERCLYILVLDARSEFNANDQAEYWLEHVKAFGKNASVMLVGNKSDLTEVNLDMNALKEKYPNIVGFYPLSCTDKTPTFMQRFAIFQTKLIEHLKAVGTHQVYFTADQFNVLKTVREQSPKQAFLSHQDFDQLCNDNSIGQQGLSKQAFLGLLDSLGEVIHFPDLARLDDYVLNPRWLTYGVYTLLYADITSEKRGNIYERDVVRTLQNETVKDEQGNILDYPSEKCGFIIDAMTEFKLCYRLPSDPKHIVIPDKLSTEQPDLSNYFDLSKPNPDCLAFEFVFRGFLPRHVMPSLIVTRHDEIVGDLVWQNGAILRSERHQALARVQVDYHKRVLQVWVQGEGRREFLEILNDEVNKILKRMEKLEYDEVVTLPIDALLVSTGLSLGEVWNTERLSIEKAPYKRLIAEARSGKQITISDTGKSYDLNKVMGLIMSKEQHGSVVNNFNLNNSPVGAIGGSGDHHTVSGIVTLNETDKAVVTEFQTHLDTLMSHIKHHEVDIDIKMNACYELQQINETLKSLESSSPEAKGKLSQFLTSIKEGSLGALKLGNEIKDAHETVTYLMTNAAVVSASLSGMGIIG